MAFGTEAANLGEGKLKVITRTWGLGEYQADLFAEGQVYPLLNLAHLEPEDIRRFAKALNAIAYQVEHQDDED
jgi:hypothetical protein